MNIGNQNQAFNASRTPEPLQASCASIPSEEKDIFGNYKYSNSTAYLFDSGCDVNPTHQNENSPMQNKIFYSPIIENSRKTGDKIEHINQIISPIDSLGNAGISEFKFEISSNSINRVKSKIFDKEGEGDVINKTAMSQTKYNGTAPSEFILQTDLENKNGRDINLLFPVDKFMNKLLEEKLNKKDIGPSLVKLIKVKCKCARSKCLKKYCECYAHGEGCNQKCKCLNCKNKKLPKKSSYNLSNTNNFSLSLDSNNPKDIKSAKMRRKCFDNNTTCLPSRQVSVSGADFCNCTRSLCQKHYCECFKNNKFCNGLCRCINCINRIVQGNISFNNVNLSINYASLNGKPQTPMKSSSHGNEIAFSFEHIHISIVRNKIQLERLSEEITSVNVNYDTQKQKEIAKKALFTVFAQEQNKNNSVPVMPMSPFLISKRKRTAAFTTACETLASTEKAGQKPKSKPMIKKNNNVNKRIEMKIYGSRKPFF